MSVPLNSWRRCWRRLAAWLLLSLCPALPARAALQLGPSQGDMDAWPEVRVLPDPGGRLSPAEALARAADFRRPEGPRANLGVQAEPVWFRVALRVDARDDSRWLAAIDFPALDHVEVWVAEAGGPARHAATLGDHHRAEAPRWSARIPAAALQLAPGQDHVLLLRVASRSSLIVPLRLMKVEAFHASESATLMAQGLAAGIGLCLLMYALANWAGSREAMFLYYGVQIACTTMFFGGLYGTGPQFLWSDNDWLVDSSTPLAALMALGAGLLLLERMLDMRGLHPRVADAATAVAGCCFVLAAGFVAGVLDYGATQTAARLLGPVPMLLAIPVAWIRWRQGDRGAPYVLAGWAVYAAGALVLTLTLRGKLGWTASTAYAAQLASIFEMGMWLHVLGLRHAQTTEVARRAATERDAMQRLAQTDALTGLPNRRGLQLRLAEALATSRPQHLLAVFLLDLDGFKPVNDRHGHDVGDALLVAVGQRLQAHLRATDVVARLGGDEFVVLAIGLPDENAAAVLGRKLLAAFEAPFDAAGKRCEVGLTAGYALAPLDGTTADALIKCADAAMYAGKQAGRRRVGRGVPPAAAATA